MGKSSELAQETKEKQKLFSREEAEKPCKYCKELDSEGFVYPDEPHHGSVYFCEECDAEYYKEWGTETINACNTQAQLNHPKLNVL